MKFDEKRYKVYTWKNWMVLHWILNPALAINELILGQRIPKISIEDKTIDKPRFERSFVPCPHCKTIHDSRVWALENRTSFKNWFGLYCKECGKIIPCLTNLTTFLLLLITYPIWGWFRESLKRRWLEKQPKRYQNVSIKKTDNPFSEKNWFMSGMVWATFIFLINSIILPYFFYDKEITLKSLVGGVIASIIGGVIFGYTMKLFNNKREKKALFK
ncbi:MAG: hypothetical protein CR982_02445 [Candidatus Cloacimonadota bacterium]|nr:MAG: hypothetical protein CR982_02445 [Candidatus Cloacimonadota bacterium]PIE78537.1 MAG: hypothetical protein CSA15_07535 [Candidatus Delongbacteria bacterium]